MDYGSVKQNYQYHHIYDILSLPTNFTNNDFETAIKSFQGLNSIPANGILGKATFEAIMSKNLKTRGSTVPSILTNQPIGQGDIRQVDPTQIKTASTTAPEKDVLEGYSKQEEPYLKAILSTIGKIENYKEASDQGYKSLVGGGQFDSYYDHPRISVHVKIHGKTISSTCAGRHQIRAKNWDFLIKKYRDFFVKDNNGHIWFSPENQDIAALLLITKVRGLTPKVLQKIINSGDTKQIFRLLRNEWASLPGNRYNQNPRSMEEVLKIYNYYLEIEKAKACQPPSPNV